MSDVLLRIDQLHLRNAEHMQQQNDFRQEINNAPAAVRTALQRVLTPYDVVLDEVRSAFLLSNSSLITEQMETADVTRDTIFSGFNFHIEGQLRFPDATVQAAALLVRHEIDTYGSNIQGQTYNAETASIAQILTNLSTKPSLIAAMTTIGATPWIAQLRTANNNFAALFNQRDTETATTHLPFTLRQKRREIAQVYEKVLVKIEDNYGVADGAAPWGPLVEKLNARAQYYKNLLDNRGSGGPVDDGSAPES